MKHIFLLISTLFLVSTITQAQTVEDAIRYSNLSVGGTARTIGAGGAFGALGADFAGISINPAGLGMYRSSEFVVTPAFNIATTDAELVGAATERERRFNFNFNNIGVVFQSEGSAAGKWKSNAFAIGYNRIANFNRNIYYEGTTAGSISDRFLQEAYGFWPEELSFESSLAYEAGALFQFDENDNTSWTTDYFDGGGNQMLYKQQTINQKGSINEMVLAFGANYNHRLMFGATVGIPIISFEETKVYDEIDMENEIDVFNELHYEQSLTTSGIGINLKLGMVYRISQMFRFGLAVHSPTGMGFNDTFKDSMSYDLTTANLNGTFEAGSPDGSYDYRLATPWKAVVSGAAIIGKSGFISADVEYMDYAFTNFNFTADNDNDLEFEETLNADIDNQLTTAINIRVGGEYAIKNYRIRAGYTNYGSYRAQSGIQSNQSISAGLGIRNEYFYADLAFRRSMNEDDYIPYRMANPVDGQQVDNLNKNSEIMLTFGFKF